MPTTTSVSTKTVRIVKPFDFRGNRTTAVIQESDFHFTGKAQKPIVKKYDKNFGDGDISTGSGSTTYAKLEASLTKYSEKTARLSVTYYVWEPLWGDKKKPKRDKLYFTATQDIDLSEFAGRTEKGTFDEILSWDFSTTPQQAVYQDYYKGEKHGWCKVVATAYPKVTKAQSWIPVSELRFKLDDGGSELDKAGNIGVFGRIEFDITVTIKKVETIDTEPAYSVSNVQSRKTYGSIQQSLDVSDEADNRAASILGCGYDFTGEFISQNYLKKPVLNIQDLNAYKRVNRNNNSGISIMKVVGENTKELSSSYASKIGGGISLSFLGVAFKHKTLKTVNETNYSKLSTRSVSATYINSKRVYKIDYGDNLGCLVPFFTNTFLEDLDKLESGRMLGRAFISKYGTHVMVGTAMGAFLDYSMSYSKSISKYSHSETYSSSAGISYKSNGVLEGDLIPNSMADDAFNTTQNASTTTYSNCTVNNTVNNYYNTNSSSGNSGNAAGVGSARSNYSNINEENKSVKVYISGAGGDEMNLSGLVNGDPNCWSAWVGSIKGPETWSWCNHPMNSLIPIYQFAKTQAQSDKIKKAWIQYLKSNSSSINPLGEKVVSKQTEVAGANNEVLKLRSDAEICTQSGKESQFQLAFTPVNIDGGKVALAIRYKVSERKMEGRDSLLQLSKVIEMPKDNSYKLAVSPHTMTCYESSVMSITGKVHGWIDITEQLENCPFVETKSHRVLVKIDGSGDDQKNMKIKATFCVPVVYYK